MDRRALAEPVMPAKKSFVQVPRFRSFRARSAKTSRVGAGNRRQDTTPESVLRAALRASGIRYRSHANALTGCPDLVLLDHRVAVFCDGDFWHGRHWSKRKSKLLSGWNAQYWVAKIERNRQRDRSVTRGLRNLDWQVVRVWESDLLRSPLRTIAKILEATRVAAPSRSNRDTPR